MNVPPERKFDMVSGLSFTYCSQIVPLRIRRAPEEDGPAISPVPARPIVSDPLLTRMFHDNAHVDAVDADGTVRLSLKFFVNVAVSLQDHVFNQEQVGLIDEPLPLSV